MPAHATKEEYFSGQGVVLVARRNPVTGKPIGYRPVGNCPALAVQFETSTLEHKESTTGARGTDLRLTTELKANLNFTLENFRSQNLADAIRAAYEQKQGGTISGEEVIGYPGLITALERIKVSAVTIAIAGGSDLTPYVDDATPWDYKLNSEAGSFQINDGSEQDADALAETITAVTVGATTSLAVANSKALVGGKYTPKGLTGADAALLNGKTFTVSSVTSAAVVLAVNTTGKTITATGTPTGVSDSPIDLEVDYTHEGQYQVDALTEGAVELALRFEGLNTANENAPVVVEVFRFLTDPAQELSLIGDGVQSFVMQGSVLADTTRVTGSKFVAIKKLT